MAQAVVLVMENKNQADLTRAKQLAGKTLSMAVQRATNDNMIRYLRVCLWCWGAVNGRRAVGLVGANPIALDGLGSSPTAY
jgi:hypothetical protein